jgi:hypothetical protein
MCYFRSKVWKLLRMLAIYVCATLEGCEKSIIFGKIPKLLLFPLLYLQPYVCHSLPHLWKGPWLQKMVMPDVLFCCSITDMPAAHRLCLKCLEILRCRFVQRHIRKLFWTSSESSWPDGANRTSSVLYAYPGPNHRHLKTQTKIFEGLPGARLHAYFKYVNLPLWPPVKIKQTKKLDLANILPLNTLFKFYIFLSQFCHQRIFYIFENNRKF